MLHKTALTKLGGSKPSQRWGTRLTCGVAAGPGVARETDASALGTVSVHAQEPLLPPENQRMGEKDPPFVARIVWKEEPSLQFWTVPAVETFDVGKTSSKWNGHVPVFCGSSAVSSSETI